MAGKRLPVVQVRFATQHIGHSVHVRRRLHGRGFSRAAVALGIAGSMLVFADIGLRLLVRFQGRKPDADPTQP